MTTALTRYGDYLAATGTRSPAVRVVPAIRSDQDYVIEAFGTALEPFYGGDHEGHARRVLETHLAGGVDPRGGLSDRQLLLVLWHGGRRLGLLNLVFKRQNTCKISPLLLYPDADSSRGLGSVLVAVALREAAGAGARQLYCTVTEKNHDALSFFLLNGFSVCGHADGQYKEGQTEVLLTRPLPIVGPNSLDQESIISVSEFRQDDGQDDGWDTVRRLVLDTMSPVDGVDEFWPDCLRAAGGSVFCARDRAGSLRATAVAVPKKGGAVKVMPIAARDDEAFRALVLDLPSLLERAGRKAYLHLSPTADQVAALQESAWVLEALLPSAYSTEQVTQQWGCLLGEDAPVKRLRIHRRYLDMIKSGRKTLEIRVGYDHITSIRPGTRLLLAAKGDNFRCLVAAVRTYSSFDEMLRHEDVRRALPGVDAAEALAQLSSIYPPDKEKLGVFVLELDPEGVEGEDNDRPGESGRYGDPE